MPQTVTAVGIIKAARPALSTVFKPALEEIGEAGRDYVKGLRAKAGAKVLIDAGNVLVEANIEPQEVPFKVLVPLIESASLEEDEFLQKTWANLLANAANPHSVAKFDSGFIEIMKQLGPIHVRILNALFPESRGGIKKAGSLFMMDTNFIKEAVVKEGISGDEFDVALDNLVRLRLCIVAGTVSMIQALNELIKGGTPELSMATGYGTANIGPTKLGIAFLKACSAPVASSPSAD